MDFKRLDNVKSCLLALAAAAALPTADAAAAQASASTGGQSAPSTDPAPAAPESAPSATGLEVPSGLLVHQVAPLLGKLPGAPARATVAIERFDSARGIWTPIAVTTTGAGGAFVAHWRADHIGRFTLRAVRARARMARAAQQSPSGAPTAQLTVYRGATASWFGPGFYGKQTACGETMSSTLLGVAHRSLPCGTLVEISYGGHSVTVPVVDRGPYRHGVAWDLTTATAQAVGLTENARIGALALRGVFGPPTATGIAAPTTSNSAGGQGSTAGGSQAGGARAAYARG